MIGFESLRLVAGVPVRITVPALAVPADWLEQVDVSGLLVCDQVSIDLGARAVVSASGPDLLVTVDLTGADTASLPGRGRFDLRLSDVGAVDARALLIVRGLVSVEQLTTQTATTVTVGLPPAPLPAGSYVGAAFAGQTYASGGTP